MLHLRTFGGVALLQDDRPLGGTAAQKRRLALLALIAVAGDRGMSRDKIASLLWPESDQERARHSLSQWLFTTRRDLKVEDMFVGTTELRLNPDRISSDVATLERAIAAGELETVLQCYDGPFLDGFHLSGASEFERWVDGERERLAQRYRQALETLAERRAVAGDARGALDVWRKLAGSDPYNGRVALGLMRALTAVGDTAGALTYARVHATLLREELGAEPQPDVAAFAEQLRVAPAPSAPVTAAPTTEVLRPEAALALVPAAPDAERNGLTAPFTTALPRRRRLIRPIAIATTLAVCTLAAASWFVPGPVRAMAYTLTTRDPIALVSRRIVVAPLEDLSRDTALATFGYIASGWVTEELTETGEFEVVDVKTSYVTSKVVARIPAVFRADDRAVALAEETGAGLLISGSYYKEGDSIRVQVLLTDLAARRVIKTLGPPIVGAVGKEQQLIERLARRVVGMAATAVDTSPAHPTLGGTFPSSYAGFRESTKAWERFYEADIEGFYHHARRASALDTAYMMPVMMQSYVRSDAREWPQADTLVQILEAHRAGLSALEQAGTDMLSAAVRGDLDAHLRGAIEVTRAAPASAEVRTYAARVAVNANQPDRALAILGSVDPSRGVMLFAPWYWNWRAAAHHLAGAHDAELIAAREGVRRFPRSETAVASLGRALAVKGKGGDLHAMLDRLPRASSPAAHRRWKIALDWTRELRAHGHHAQSQRLLETLHAQLVKVPRDSARSSDRFRATVLADLGHATDAYAMWTAVSARDPESVEALGNLGMAAARSARIAHARQVERLIATRSWSYAHGRDTMWRARIAAALGDPDRAVTLVDAALRQGYARFYDPGGGPHDEPELHADPAFQSLRNLPAFAMLLAPKG